MVIEMHLNGVPEAVFLRDRDADAFLGEYRGWIKDQDKTQIFEFFHNGSIHCFAFGAVMYLKVKMPTEAQTLELAIEGSLLGTGRSSVRH